MASDCVPHRKALLEQVHALTLTPSGQLVSASADGSIRIWDLMRFRAIVALIGHAGSVLCCAGVSGAYAEADAAAAAANAAAADAADAAAAAAAAADADASVLFSADAKGELLRWSVRPLPVLGLAGGSVLPTARVHVTEKGGGVYALAFAASSLIITAGADHRVRLWNPKHASSVGVCSGSALATRAGRWRRSRSRRRSEDRAHAARGHVPARFGRCTGAPCALGRAGAKGSRPAD